MITLLLLINSCVLFSQNIDIKLTASNRSEFTGSSIGDKMIELKKHSLIQIASKVFDISQEQISIDPTLASNSYNLLVKSDETLLKEQVISAFKAYLKESFILEESKVEKFGIKLSPEIGKTIPNCTNLNNGELKSIRRINRTWKDLCVNSNDLKDIIQEWFSMPVINLIDPKLTFDVALQYNKLNIVKENLLMRYNINLEETSLEMNHYHIKEK